MPVKQIWWKSAVCPWVDKRGLFADLPSPPPLLVHVVVEWPIIVKGAARKSSYAKGTYIMFDHFGTFWPLMSGFFGHFRPTPPKIEHRLCTFGSQTLTKFEHLSKFLIKLTSTPVPSLKVHNAKYVRVLWKLSIKCTSVCIPMYLCQVFDCSTDVEKILLSVNRLSMYKF